MSKKNDYRQIFKATGLFGGVQAFNIVLGFARNKAIAYFLGPEGVGIITLFNSVISLISSFTGLGLGFSAVRNISQATESADHDLFNKTAITVRRWMWFSGLLGTVITLLLSPLLSLWQFGSYSYTASFIWIAFTFLISSQTVARNTMLHGMRKLKLMARSNVAGSVVGLFISLPLYYFYGVRGIVPALLITAVSGFVLAWYFTRNIEVAPLDLTLKESFIEGRDMVKLGIMTTLSATAWYAVNNLVNIYVRWQGGVEMVGFYQAGHSITNQIVNLVFMAMIVDFYPRLSAIHRDVSKVREAVNQQVEIAALLITPLVLLFVSFLPIVILIMYTPDFMPVMGYVKWYFLGILFKATYWSMGYIILAKGDTRTYFFVELTSCMVFALLAIAGFRLFGLEGLGASYLIAHFLFCILYYQIVRKKYSFVFERKFVLILLVQMVLSLALFLFVHFGGYPVASVAGLGLFVVSGLYSFRQISNRLDLKELIANKFKKKQ